MNHYEAVITLSKKIESILEKDFDAEGKGIIEKSRNVRHQLSQELFQNILEFGRIRNKLVHEEEFEIEDNNKIERLTNSINNGLQDALEHIKKTPLQCKHANIQLDQDEWNNYCRTSAISGDRMYRLVPIGLGAFAVFYWMFFM
jgi:sensor domain CHASE-containing protein